MRTNGICEVHGTCTVLKFDTRKKLDFGGLFPVRPIFATFWMKTGSNHVNR